MRDIGEPIPEPEASVDYVEVAAEPDFHTAMAWHLEVYFQSLIWRQTDRGVCFYFGERGLAEAVLRSH